MEHEQIHACPMPHAPSRHAVRHDRGPRHGRESYRIALARHCMRPRACSSEHRFRLVLFLSVPLIAQERAFGSF